MALEAQRTVRMIICFNVTTPLKAWNARPRLSGGRSQRGFNVTTPLKAWNVRAAGAPPTSPASFNVTTPLKAWNDADIHIHPARILASM